jgi:hypothetical protein
LEVIKAVAGMVKKRDRLVQASPRQISKIFLKFPDGPRGRPRLLRLFDEIVSFGALDKRVAAPPVTMRILAAGLTLRGEEEI